MKHQEHVVGEDFVHMSVEDTLERGCRRRKERRLAGVRLVEVERDVERVAYDLPRGVVDDYRECVEVAPVHWVLADRGCAKGLANLGDLGEVDPRGLVGYAFVVQGVPERKS